MKKIQIEHFWGEKLCEQLDGVRETLELSVKGRNEFFVVQDQTPHPYLMVLVNGPYANAAFILSEESADLQAFWEEDELVLDPKGSTIFYTNTPAEEIEVYNAYVCDLRKRW